LAKAGQQVLVLEQHDIAGGSTHAFVDHGDEFDTGVHYIGNMEKRKVVLDQITDTPIEWDQLGHEIYNKTDGVPDYVYDEVYIGTGDKRECYKFRAGEKNFTYDLVEKFPEEEDFIRKYVSLIKKVAKKDMFFMAKIIRPSWLADIVLKYFCNDYYKWVNTTTYQILSAMTNNKKLISVLCGQFGDQGRTPKTSSFFMHASIVNHYLKGAWYPRGGSAEFANKIIPTIEKAGGRVLVGKAVKRIIIVNNRAIGVVMENDDKIFAHNVVSSAGIYNTYHKLMHEKHASSDPLYQLTINYGTNSQESIQIKPSCTMIYLFVGLDKTSEELQLRSSNIWSLPCKQEYDYDMDKMMNDYLNDYTNDMPIFMGFPSAKDTTYNERCPGKSCAVILTYANYLWFKEFEHLSKTERKKNDKYNKLKKYFEERMLSETFKYYPQLKDHITNVLIGTPLTFNYYIGSTFGEVYGMDSTRARYNCTKIKPETSIENLFLTGQDVTTLGITGAIMSGVLTSMTMLGYGTWIDCISGRNIVDDTKHFNDRAE
jgi:all-trans-retinol 13,14-reductase